jgi:hypothetical protein
MIDSYGFGFIVVDGQRYTSDIIIYPDRVESDWRRKTGHRLALEDLGQVLEQDARTLVVGTGYYGLVTVPSETLEPLESAGFEVVVERTAQACETYNHVVEKGPVIAALHLAC